MKTNVYDEGRAADVPHASELATPSARKPKAPARKASAAWLVGALILLSAIPLAAGVFRLIQLASGAAITPANARFFASPIPVVVHIVNACVYALLGATQFATGYRRRWLAWHRVVGRLLVVCGLLVGLSGLWMTLFYPRAEGTGDLLYALRLLFGSAMVVCILLGFETIRRGDVLAHRAWMMRAYAIGLGAGTQAFTQLVAGLIVSPPNELSTTLAMGTGWVINLAVAEWAIQRMPAQRARTAALAAAHLQ